MPYFLFTARNSHGKKVTERIEAEDVASARNILENRNYTAIVFHDDDLAGEYQKFLGCEKPPSEAEWPAKMAFKASTIGGVWSHIWFGLKGNAIFWVPLVIWNGYTIVRGLPLTWFSWLGFILGGVFLYYFMLVSLPGVAYQALLEASVWSRWDDVQTWVQRIRALKSMYQWIYELPVPEMELDVRLANALAAEGKLHDALQLVAKYEDADHIAKNLYFGRIASIYEYAREFGKMAECQKKAVEYERSGAGERIDLAITQVKRLNDPQQARQTLSTIEGFEITDIAASYVSFCEGLIALAEEKYQEAEEFLTKALHATKPYAATVLMQSFIAEIKTYLCITVGELGKKEHAQRLFEEVLPRLKARQENDLIERCQAVLE